MPEKRFEIIVRAIVKDQRNRILFVKRVQEPEKDKWSLPGGKVILGETLEYAIKREIKEELGLTFFPKFYSYSEKPHNLQLHTITFHFTGDYQGDIKLKTDENSEYRFFQENELVKKPDIAWNHKELGLRLFR